jgi:hypothetical protein
MRKIMNEKIIQEILKIDKEAAGAYKGKVPMMVYDSLTNLETSVDNFRRELSNGDYDKSSKKLKVIEDYVKFLKDSMNLANEHWKHYE